MSVTLRVLTFNCWGIHFVWPVGSKDRHYRIRKLIEAMLTEEYDIISLQEVWCQGDFELIKNCTMSKYPYSHYFHSGFTGSGVCVFSRYTIVSAIMHRYSLNGFFHHIHRGDWLGGKVVGMVEVEVDDYRVNFYCTHLHAEYDAEYDFYLPHRLTQALELSQFIKYTSGSSDVSILAGDLNIEPDSIGYRFILSNTNLKDVWRVKENCEESDGTTCSRPDNYYTPSADKISLSPGKRIDYIMYDGVRSDVDLVRCEQRLGLIPESDGLSYSDHVAVYAEFTLHDKAEVTKHCTKALPAELLQSSIKILSEGENRAMRDRRLFNFLSVGLVLLLLGSTSVDLLLPQFAFLITFSQFFLTVLLVFSLWHGGIGLRMELKALKNSTSTLILLLNE